MAAAIPPICDFGRSAPNFDLLGVDNETYTFEDIKGPNGALVIFICNHCPYVLAILDRLIRDVSELKSHGIGSVAISSNDVIAYPQDSFDNMRLLSENYSFSLPYLFDSTQSVAKAYEAVCTPDFFGYNSSGELQYRGRLDASRKEAGPSDLPRDLFNAMVQIAQTGKGPTDQVASMGCSIKWK